MKHRYGEIQITTELMPIFWNKFGHMFIPYTVHTINGLSTILCTCDLFDEIEEGLIIPKYKIDPVIENNNMSISVKRL